MDSSHGVDTEQCASALRRQQSNAVNNPKQLDHIRRQCKSFRLQIHHSVTFCSFFYLNGSCYDYLPLPSLKVIKIVTKTEKKS